MPSGKGRMRTEATDAAVGATGAGTLTLTRPREEGGDRLRMLALAPRYHPPRERAPHVNHLSDLDHFVAAYD